MDAPNQPGFLRLPVELRLTIYEHVFIDWAQAHKGSTVPIPLPPILTVNRKIHNEAFDFYPRLLESQADELDKEADELCIPLPEGYEFREPFRGLFRAINFEDKLVLRSRAIGIRSHIFYLTGKPGGGTTVEILEIPLKAGDESNDEESGQEA